MIPAIGSLWAKLVNAEPPETATQPSDMSSQQRDNTRPSRLQDPADAMTNLRSEAQGAVSRSERRHQDRLTSTSFGYAYQDRIQKDIDGKTRRVLAVELDQSRKERSILDTNFRKLQQKNKDLITENKTLHDKNAALQDDIRVLHEENRQGFALEATHTPEYQGLVADYLEMRDERDSMISRYNNVDVRYKYIVEKVLKPYASTKNEKYNDKDGNSMNLLLDPLLKDVGKASSSAEYVRVLEEQVRSLQQQLLSNVEKIEPVSDENFAAEFRSLGSSIKTLSRPFSSADTSAMIRVDSIRQSLLLGRVATEKLCPSARKRNIVEAFVWSVLYSSVFDSPFFVFAQIDLAFDFRQLFGEDHQHQWPTPSTLSERWRLTSMEQMLATVEKNAITHGIVKNPRSTFETDIRIYRSKVTKDIIKSLSLVLPRNDFAIVTKVVDKAFSMAIQMFLQRCRMQLVYPQIGDPYDKGQSHLDSIAESIEVEKGSVALIVSPGLAKWGDTEGKRLDQRLDLVPAMVLADPAAKKDDDDIFQAEQLTSTKDESSVPIEPHTRKTIHPKVVIQAKPKSKCPMIKIENTEMADDSPW